MDEFTVPGLGPHKDPHQPLLGLPRQQEGSRSAGTCCPSGPPCDTTPKLTPGSVHTFPAAWGARRPPSHNCLSPKLPGLPLRPTSSHTLVRLLGNTSHQPCLAVSGGSLLSPRSATRAGWLRALPRGRTGRAGSNPSFATLWVV